MSRILISAGLPLFYSKVSAGFPSPAEDYIDQELDLNAYLIKHPAATYFVKAAGTAMLSVGIHPNDLLIVDRSLTPVNGAIVIAVIEGRLMVKQLRIQGDTALLTSDYPYFSSIDITDQDLRIWGVVTTVIHKV